MDNLVPDDQAKLQNILRYYTEYRKTHYDDNDGIAIENKRREQQQEEIRKELQKLQKVRETEQYVGLINEKAKIYEQIETYEGIIDEIRDTYEEYNTYEDSYDNEEVQIICDKIEKLFGAIKTIECKQLDVIKVNGIDTELLEDRKIESLL